jgi:hypothetical protein
MLVAHLLVIEDFHLQRRIQRWFEQFELFFPGICPKLTGGFKVVPRAPAFYCALVLKFLETQMICYLKTLRYVSFYKVS